MFSFTNVRGTVHYKRVYCHFGCGIEETDTLDLLGRWAWPGAALVYLPLASESLIYLF